MLRTPFGNALATFAAFTAGGQTYRAGAYVIGPQAFRPYVIDLIEPKRYPDRRQYPGGPPEPPYDMTGYELALQMGVTVARVLEPFPLPARIADTIPPAGIGFDERFVGWGYEDEDLGRRLRRRGVEIGFAPALTTVVHLWHPPDPTAGHTKVA